MTGFPTDLEARRKPPSRGLLWLWPVAIGVGLVGLLPCALLGTLVIAWLGVVLSPEHDGSRPLQNGYELWMLKGYPRHIAFGSGSRSTPRGWQHDTHEVGQYGTAGGVYFGELIPFTPPVSDGKPRKRQSTRYFILNTADRALDEFDAKEAWRARLQELQIDVDQVEWLW